jgi:sodium-dependent dicarboxylate transporter 2/3/5
MLMVPATLASSFAFLMPVATPPNAIIFGTGRVTIREMFRIGLTFEIIGVILITISIFLLGSILDIDVSQFPAWAK